MKLIVSLLALLVTSILAACGGGGDQAQAGADAPAGDYSTLSGGPPGGVAIAMFNGEPDNLNPLTYSSDPAYQAIHLMFRALAVRDSTLSGFRPDLARSWELRPDSTLVIRLRNDVKWHDGVPVTADDVVFTIQRQQDEATASPRKADVAAVTRATATDSFTVEVKLSQTGPYTVNALLEVVPVPRHLLEGVAPAETRLAPFSRNPVGNGYFRFVRWQSGQNLTLEANTEAPEGRPALDRVVMRFVPDMSTALTELLAGQADVLKIPPDQKQRVEATDGVELYNAPRVRPAWIVWNTDRPPVDDPRVRQAILMGIDRERLAAGLFGEEGEAALSPLPPSVREHSASVRPLGYDPAAAQRLLEAAGWRDSNGDGIREKGGRPLRLEVDYIATEQVRQDVLVAIQSMLRQIGVDLAPQPFERTAWVERLRNRQFQGSLWGWGWGPGVVGPNAEMVFHSRSVPPAGVNFAGYRNARVDQLIDAALVTHDTAQARQIWAQLEQQLITDAAYAPLYLDPELYAVHQRIRNAEFDGIELWENIPYWYIPEQSRLPRDRSQ